MLTSLVVNQFKAFGSRQQVELAPITLIFGGNSAGKSSLIQSLLLLRQSIAPTGFSPAYTRPAELVVRGAFVDLGSFDALVHGHDRTSEVTLGIGARVDRARGYRFARLAPGVTVDVEWTYGRSPNASEIRHRFSTIRAYGDEITCAAGLGPSGLDMPGVANQRALSILNSDDTATLFSWARQRLDKTATPGTYPPEGSRAIVRLSAGIPIEVVGFADRSTSEGSINRLDDESPQLTRIRSEARNVADIDFASDWLRAGPVVCRNELNGISYIGPMRAAPQRLNILSGEQILDTGVAGEHVVDLLAKRRTLLEEVNVWFERLEIPYTAEIRRVSDGDVVNAIGEVHCLLLRDRQSGIEVSPTDVGFGIGQVLPVVVQSLLHNRGAICIEQPELHLHPGLQARLAELFAHAIDPSPTAGQRQFILETHSEHLILRLQRLVRMGRLDPRHLSVLHVGATSEGETVVKQIGVADSGDFTDEWPGGFFDERYDEIFGDW